MPTPTTNFRLSRETRAAMEHIADLVRRQRTRPVTTTDVLRWLVAMHDPKNDPDLTFTHEQALVFPVVYRSPCDAP